MKALRTALSAGDYQWAAQLSDYFLALDPNAVEIKGLKAQALEALAERTVNAPARNYYLTAAQELRKRRRSSRRGRLWPRPVPITVKQVESAGLGE